MAIIAKTFSLAIPAAVTNGISTSQTPLSAGNLTITGSLASGGVASLVTAQRVGVHSAADETARTFTIYGTDRYGRAQTEAVTGGNATTVNTTHDFITVTRIAVDAATAGAVYAGTVGVGSSIPTIMDTWPSTELYTCVVTQDAAANWSIEVSADNLAPAWDVNTNSPYWYAATGFSAQTAAQKGTIQGPLTMIRLTINSGAGTVTVRLIEAFVAGAV